MEEFDDTYIRGFRSDALYKLMIDIDIDTYGAPARHEKSYLLQFVQTNCNLFEQIVICSNKHIIICLKKL